MAIHIRPRKSPLAAVRRRRFRNTLAALLAALMLVTVVGTVLYLIIVNIPRDHSTSFISYTPETQEEDFDDTPVTQDITPSSAAAAAASAQVTPQIIVAAGTSSLQLPAMDFSIDGDISGMGVGIVDGIGTATLGDGTGMGNGNGRGDGPGTGGGRHGKGSNDDIQVVIILDASGSMDQLFQQVSQSLEQLLNMLNSCRINGRPAKVNVGIVAYGAARDGGAPWLVSRFSKDVKGMSKRVAEVACDGSEEHCGAALMFALKEFPWNMRERDQILKVIFIAGNESFSQGPVNYHKALAQAREMGIIVNTICCGPMEPDWEEAAREGGGEAFSVDLNEGSSATPAQRLQALRRLRECEVIPTGSPADIERHEQELRRRPQLPNEKGMDKWLAQNQRDLLNGYDWDAVEICRRMGDDFTLDMVGGLGNLPERVRSMGAAGALDHIRRAAAARQDAINSFKEMYAGGSGFCNAAMEALRKQAAQKGIDIEF